MAGLIERFEWRLGDKSVFEIWQKHLHVGLMWSIDHVALPHVDKARYPRARVQGMASWSWLSVNRPIDFGSKTSTRKLVPKAIIEPVEGGSCLRILCQRVPGTRYKSAGTKDCCKFRASSTTSDADWVSFLMDDTGEVDGSDGPDPKLYHCLPIA